MNGDSDARINLHLTGEHEVSRGLDNVADKADKAGESVEGLGDSAVKAGDESEKAGKKFEATGNEAEQLARKIELAKKAQQDLIREFARTDDAGTDREVGKASRRLAKLERYAKILLPDEEEPESVGKQIGTKLIKGLTEATGASPEALAGIAALAAAAAPAIGATISGAVLGGVGLGGIIGGVALAARDDRVKAEAANMAAEFAKEFGALGNPFIQPVIEAEKSLGSASSRWADKLAPGMEKLASKVGPLDKGIEGLVDRALPGFLHALDSAGPVLDTLTNELPELGQSFGDLFDDLAANPVAAQHAIEELTDAIEGTVEMIGNFVRGLTTVYQTSLEITQGLGITELSVKGVGGALYKTTEATLQQADANKEAAASTWDYKAAVDALYGRTRDVQEANIAYEQSVDDLTKGLTDGKRTLDITTQAGRDNWEVINNTADAIKDLRQANIDNNMPLDQANKLYEEQFKKLRDTLLALGYNKKAVDDYINSLLNIPGRISTAFYAPGLDSLLAKAGRLDRTMRQYGGEDLQYGGGFQARAGGGPVDAGVPYIVGEHGPELVVPRANGTVMTAAQTRAMLSGQSGGSAAPAVIVLHASDAGVQALLDMMQFTAEQVVGAEADAIRGGVRG